LLTILPRCTSVSALPPTTNEPAAASKVIPPNVVPLGKLLTGVRRVAPVNMSASSGAGVRSVLQLVGVIQLSSLPPPSQVIVPAETCDDTDIAPTATEAAIINLLMFRCFMALTPNS
jgi:hypothetical protein